MAAAGGRFKRATDAKLLTRPAEVRVFVLMVIAYAKALGSLYGLAKAWDVDIELLQTWVRGDIQELPTPVTTARVALRIGESPEDFRAGRCRPGGSHKQASRVADAKRLAHAIVLDARATESATDRAKKEAAALAVLAGDMQAAKWHGDDGKTTAVAVSAPLIFETSLLPPELAYIYRQHISDGRVVDAHVNYTADGLSLEPLSHLTDDEKPR
jgi:hypothetical protein